MAADILLYNANIIPVGEDQKQHIELARDIAISFNRKANIEVFTVPDVLINSKAKRIMSLKDASKKMSKSDLSDLSRINMSDDAELIRKKIRKAKTDDIEGIRYDPEKRPEISNLIDIYHCFSNSHIDEITDKFKSSKNSEFKESLANIIIKNICPIHKKAIEILEDKKYLEQIIKDGTIRAKAIAEKNISKVKQIIGIN